MVIRKRRAGHTGADHYASIGSGSKRHERRFPSQRQLPPKSDRTYTFEFFGRFLPTIQSTGQLEYWCCASRWRRISSAVRLARRSIVQQIPSWTCGARWLALGATVQLPPPPQNYTLSRGSKSESGLGLNSSSAPQRLSRKQSDGLDCQNGSPQRSRASTLKPGKRFHWEKFKSRLERIYFHTVLVDSTAGSRPSPPAALRVGP